MKKILLSSLIVLICISIAATFSLVGCKTASTTTTAAAETTKAAETTTTAAAETTSGKPLEFAIIYKGIHPWYDPCGAGFADAAKKIGGINTRILASKDFTGEAQAKIMEDAIASKVDGIAIAVVDAGALTPMINEAMSKGIPVICYDDHAADSQEIMFIGTENLKAGQIEGEEFAKLMNYKGNYIIWVQDLTSANLKLRTQGIRDSVKKYPDMKELSDVQLGGYNPAEGITKAENILQAYPNINGTAECGMNGAIGMYMAMKEKGMKPGSIINIGWTTLPEIIEGVKAGYIQGVVRQNPYAMGYLSVYALKWYIDGKRPTEKFFDTGVVFAKGNEVDTVDENNMKKVPQMLEEFKKLWK
ncbi:MAG: substrate-binding domain-containing protein [Cyanobacteria bacterium]|nr:substrate-binding domain-containing protein [Cyanobacteriota bacterium]